MPKAKGKVSQSPESSQEPPKTRSSSRKKSHSAKPALPKKGLVEGTDRYYLESILAWKHNPASLSNAVSSGNVEEEASKPMVFFYVKWEDWGLEESTWEPATNLLGSWHLVEAYMRTQGKQIIINKEAKTMVVMDLDDPAAVRAKNRENESSFEETRKPQKP